MVYFLGTGTLWNITDWLLPYVKSFVYFRKTRSLLNHVGCVLTQEEMLRKGRIQKEKKKAKNVPAKG